MSLLKIDLGCGPKGPARPEGYIGVDLWPGNKPDIVADITKRIEDLRSSCASEVVCNHVLEHLPPNVWQPVMWEIARLLFPGGTFAIRVPHPSYDDAMIHDHKHVLTPTFWRAMRDRDWLHGELIITDIEEVPNEPAVAYCNEVKKDFAIWSQFHRNAYRETVVRGHKPGGVIVHE